MQKKNTTNEATDYLSFTKEAFITLADVYEVNCISIYLPTQKAGKEVIEGQGQLNLKNCLKELYHELQLHKISKNEAMDYLRPAELLLEDNDFWRNQSDGLAIFLNKSGMKHYTLPLHFEKLIHINNHYYLKPLLPFFDGDGKFYLLKLSLEEVKLFEGNKYSITEVATEGIFPDRLEEITGYSDDKQKNLQFRTGHDAINAMYHGHGAGKEDKEGEIKKFFREIDTSLIRLIRDPEAPLILACQDHYFPVYEEITKHGNLYHRYVSGAPQQSSAALLHEKAWLLLEDHFQRGQKQKSETIKNLLHSEKASIQLEKIIPAAVDGRVDTLFIQDAKEIYGLYDEENRAVIIDESKGIGSAGLINLAAVKSFTQGAKVYLVYSQDIPIKRTVINALFRY